jgi:hypothetical protein
VGDKSDTANPDSKPPPEPQRSVHSDPEDPSEQDAAAGSEGADPENGSDGARSRD